MIRKVSVVVGVAALLLSSGAFADTTIPIAADQSASGTQNLYLCYDKAGKPILMDSCSDAEMIIDDDVVIYTPPPHPPHTPADPGDLIIYNEFGQSYIIRDILPDSGDVVISPENLEDSEYAELLYDDQGTYIGPDPVPYSGGVQNTGNRIATPTAPISDLGSSSPFTTLSVAAPSGGDRPIIKESREGSGGSGAAGAF